MTTLLSPMYYTFTTLFGPPLLHFHYTFWYTFTTLSLDTLFTTLLLRIFGTL